MRKYVCDNCGRELERLWYAISEYKIIGFIGKVEKNVHGKNQHKHKVARTEKEVDFEVCSKNCLLNYLRK